MGILSEVERYYTEKIRTHGPVPAGVDWNSQQSQTLRFDQLLKIIPNSTESFSILDYGCGYGSLYQHMRPLYRNFQYAGYDISLPMIDEARKLTKGAQVNLSTDLQTLIPTEYTLASGIFNVKQMAANEDWLAYVKQTLTQINSISAKGISFNMLTSYSDTDRQKDYLFYADPSRMFDFCKKNLSKNVALLHDYGLYEFTILVRKTLE